MLELSRSIMITVVAVVLVWSLSRIASHAWYQGKWKHFKRVWEATNEGEL